MTMTPSINGWRVTAIAPFRQWAGPDGFRAQELITGRGQRQRFLGILVYDERGRLIGRVGSTLDLVRL